MKELIESAVRGGMKGSEAVKAAWELIGTSKDALNAELKDAESFQRLMAPLKVEATPDKWETVKEEILRVLSSVKRMNNDSFESLTALLDKSGYWDAPVTISSHGSYPHGLMLDAWKIYQAMWRLAPMWGIDPVKRADSLALCGLLHGVGFADRIKTEPNGGWKSFRPISETNGLGSAASVILLQDCRVPLTKSEKLAILYVTGYQADEYERRSMLEAWEKCPLAALLYWAKFYVSNCPQQN